MRLRPFRSRARSSARGWQPTKTASQQSLESRQAGLRYSPAFFIAVNRRGHACRACRVCRDLGCCRGPSGDRGQHGRDLLPSNLHSTVCRRGAVQPSEPPGRWSSPIAFMPLVMVSHRIPIALYPCVLRSWPFWHNHNRPDWRWRGNHDSNGNLCIDYRARG